MFDAVWTLGITSSCLMTKQCLIVFDRQTFPVWTGLYSSLRFCAGTCKQIRATRESLVNSYQNDSCTSIMYTPLRPSLLYNIIAMYTLQAVGSKVIPSEATKISILFHIPPTGKEHILTFTYNIPS